MTHWFYEGNDGSEVVNTGGMWGVEISEIDGTSSRLSNASIEPNILARIAKKKLKQIRMNHSIFSLPLQPNNLEFGT